MTVYNQTPEQLLRNAKYINTFRIHAGTPMKMLISLSSQIKSLTTFKGIDGKRYTNYVWYDRKDVYKRFDKFNWNGEKFVKNDPGKNKIEDIYWYEGYDLTSQYNKISEMINNAKINSDPNFRKLNDLITGIIINEVVNV